LPIIRWHLTVNVINIAMHNIAYLYLYYPQYSSCGPFHICSSLRFRIKKFLTNLLIQPILLPLNKKFLINLLIQPIFHVENHVKRMCHVHGNNTWFIFNITLPIDSLTS
jgi:3'-phosphoadenosine 5'-phosphosulfate sulfotransferase (PAPS reductase)/FAD synthetase